MSADRSLSALISASKTSIESLEWQRRKVEAKLAVERLRLSKLQASAEAQRLVPSDGKAVSS